MIPSAWQGARLPSSSVGQDSQSTIARGARRTLVENIPRCGSELRRTNCSPAPLMLRASACFLHLRLVWDLRDHLLELIHLVLHDVGRRRAVTVVCWFDIWVIAATNLYCQLASSSVGSCSTPSGHVHRHLAIDFVLHQHGKAVTTGSTSKNQVQFAVFFF